MAIGQPEDYANLIPWAEFGRPNAISRVGNSLLALGTLPNDPPKNFKNPGDMSLGDLKQLFMNIEGTGIHAANGVIVTCRHVANALKDGGSKAYVLILGNDARGSVFSHFQFEMMLGYIDPRTGNPNATVDLVAVFAPVENSEIADSADLTPVRWGDSTRSGVGDPIIVGGYPFGEDLFFMTSSNKGAVQPTFYQGIISAVFPATDQDETRMFQLSVPVAGGISGGAVIDQRSGEVIGMVTSGLEDEDGNPYPMTYALPSEIIAPFATSITYRTTAGMHGAKIKLGPNGKPLKSREEQSRK